MKVEFDADVVEWRGPAPYVFARMPEPEAAQLREIAAAATYGWGCIPAVVKIGDTVFTTSLFPREGGYLVPVKKAVQQAEGVTVGDVVRVGVQIEAG
ncbi:MAG: DUF1905 domain-containing protein [Micrococcus sp.]|nr:DUF1905 domain-containing protein [Micrococcus sp.]